MRVWPTEEAMEDRLAAELAAGEACVLGEGDLTWDDLVDRVVAAAPAARPLDPVTARLTLRLACARASGLPRAAAQGRGTIAAAARFVAEAERAGLAPDAARTEAPAAQRLLDILAEQHRLTARAGQSRDRRRAEGVRAMGRGAGPRLPALDIAPRVVWEPADVELVLALARRGPVTVRLPWAPDRPALTAGLDPVLAAFEAAADTQLELILDDPTERGCARAVLAALFRPAAGATVVAPRRGAPPISILAAPHPQAELRAVAAHIRALVDDGAPPETIAIAVRQPGGDGDALLFLEEELSRVGLLLDERRRAPLAATPAARLLLAAIAVAERGWPRDEVLALLGSALVVTPVPAAEVARAARALGLRELAPRGAGLSRLAAARGGAALAEGLAAFLSPIAALPGVATLAEHAAALRHLVGALGIDRQARAAVARLDPGAPAARRIERAAARDAAAVRALVELLAHLPRAASAAGDQQPRTRGEIAALLEDLFGETPLRPRGARGGAIRLVGYAELAARRFDHLVFPGLVDGAVPARSVDDGVYGERERRAIHRALGRRVLPSAIIVRRGAAIAGAGADELGDPTPSERTPIEGLLFTCALAAAERSALLSYARTDDDRPLARSAFVDEIVRVAPWVPIAELDLSPVPALGPVAGGARAAGDLLARVALEALAAPEGRLPPRPPAPGAAALLDAAARRLPRRTARIVELAAIERARWTYFTRQASDTTTTSVYVGDIGAQAGLAARAGGDAARPIAARQLEQLAACPFTFFAGRVLGADATEEAEDAPSALSLGRLAHRCLEVFYRQRGRVGALPLAGGDADHAALRDACAEVFAEAEAQGIAGHPILWQIGKDKLVDELARIVDDEARGLRWRGVPTYFELPFGMAPRRGSLGPGLPAVELGGVHVCGRIDRVDRTADGHVVIDYKLGGRLAAKLKDAGATELQLPIYAAAVRAGLGGGAIDAAYVSVREGSATRTLSATLGAAETQHLLEIRLPARIGELGARARAGAFHVAPVDPERCLFCSYRTACRVVHEVSDEETVAA